jgi:ribosomal protein S18 acetylase RimI-like enzyme
MSKSGFVPGIVQLGPDQWHVLRDIRLSALKDSPHAFLATYEDEARYETEAQEAQQDRRSEAKWRAEFEHGDWFTSTIDDVHSGLLCITREAGAPPDECFLESLWVPPERRREGVGFAMITGILDRLQADGIRTVFLWVLDGNPDAIRLYERAGFALTGDREPLPDDPDRFEEKMVRYLA